MRASSNRLVTSHDDGLVQASTGSETADGGPQISLRASDAERDYAVGELRDRFAEGRLSQDTFLVRMDAALRAKERSELSELFTDLPEAPQRGSGVAVRRRLADCASDWPGPGRSATRAGRQRPLPPAMPLSQRTRQAGRPWCRWPAPRPALPSRCACPGTRTGGSRSAGRHRCDFTVADLSVSRWHARLHHEDDSWLLSDLGSTNGTRLNGWRVTTGVAGQAGDEVSFGTVTSSSPTAPRARPSRPARAAS